MPLVEPRAFQRLSADLSYLLDFGRIDDRLLRFLLGAPAFDALLPGERAVIIGVARYLESAYRERRRRTGGSALLHPLRTAALLARVTTPTPAEILLALLHDQVEDIVPSLYSPDRWALLEANLEEALAGFADDDRWYLMERVDLLARRQGESYSRYLGRLAERSATTPALLRVKASDRLDNSLDLYIFTEGDPLADADFFEAVFRTLFVRAARPFVTTSLEPFSPSKRAYELFKNAVLLGIVRASPAPGDAVVSRLLDGVLQASIHEAQSLVLHLLARAGPRARDILLDAMHYAHGGGVEEFTGPGAHPLDGLFVEIFDQPDSETRRSRVRALESDVALLGTAAVAILALFQGLREPSFELRGVSLCGLTAGVAEEALPRSAAQSS